MEEKITKVYISLSNAFEAGIAFADGIVLVIIIIILVHNFLN